MKNKSPKQIAFLTASINALGIVLILIGFSFWQKNINSLLIIAVSLISFLLSYFIFFFSVRKFIHKNIQVIYKTISSIQNIKTNMEEIHSQDDILGEVKEEVLKWATEKKNEIEQLKKIEAYRKEFLENVSHELKTPIFAIQGYLHTLIDGGIEDMNINLNFLYKAAKNVDRLCAIVEDLEIISRVEAGELRLDKFKFDIHALAQEVIESLERQAEYHNNTFVFEKGSDRPAFVIADKERIRQVLVNLISNAVKYGKRGGKTRRFRRIVF